MKHLLQKIFGIKDSNKLHINQSTFKPQCDALEDRLVMAGNVMVSLKCGLLSITGDYRANDVKITREGDYLQVTGEYEVGALTTLNGQTAPLSFYLGKVEDIRIDMRGGNDVVTLGHRHDAFFPDSWNLDYRFVSGNLDIYTGSGSDRVNLWDIKVEEATNVWTDRDYGSLYACFGHDTVEVVNSSFDEASFYTGHGDDKIIFTGQHIDGNWHGSSHLQGDLLIDAGQSSSQKKDIVDLYNVFAFDIDVRTGMGNDLVKMKTVYATCKNIEVRTNQGADVIDALSLNAEGDIFMHTNGNYAGDLGDTVYVDYANAKAMRIYTGDGNDAVALNHVTVTKNLNVFLDSGNDSLKIANSAAHIAYLRGDSGYDTLALTNNDFDVLYRYYFEYMTEQ